MKRMFGLGKNKKGKAEAAETEPKEKHRSESRFLGMSTFGKSNVPESSCGSDLRSASFSGDRTTINRQVPDSDHATSRRLSHQDSDKSNRTEDDHERMSRKRSAGWDFSKNLIMDFSKLPKSCKVTFLHGRPSPVNYTGLDDSELNLLAFLKAVDATTGHYPIMGPSNIIPCEVCLETTHISEDCPYHDSAPLDVNLAPQFELVCNECWSSRHPLEHVRRI